MRWSRLSSRAVFGAMVSVRAVTSRDSSVEQGDGHHKRDRLYYNRARYYDPTLARFISEDSIDLKAGVNLYAYARDDPVNGLAPMVITASATPSGPLQVRRSYSFQHLVWSLRRFGERRDSWICHRCRL
jgi:RHS repeat-associated protein